MSQAGLVRVVVAEDNRLFRQGVVSLLEPLADIDVVAQCGDLAELRATVDEHEPDVVVTDIRMPPSQTDEGVQAATWLAETRASARLGR